MPDDAAQSSARGCGLHPGAQGDAGKGDESNSAPAAMPASTDALGLPLQPALTAVFAGRAEFDAVLAVRDQLDSVIDQLARTPAGAALGQQLIRVADIDCLTKHPLPLKCG
jgi:hypothetical protein